MLGLHLHVWPVSQYTCRSRIEKDEKEREGESHNSLPTKKITCAQSFSNIGKNVEVASALALFLNRKKREITCMSLTLARQFERERDRLCHYRSRFRPTKSPNGVTPLFRSISPNRPTDQTPEKKLQKRNLPSPSLKNGLLHLHSFLRQYFLFPFPFPPTFSVCTFRFFFFQTNFFCLVDSRKERTIRTFQFPSFPFFDGGNLKFHRKSMSPVGLGAY